MLSYQHGYHAGAMADVVKHVILTRILHYLTQKDKPLFYLETHAGRGHYDLQDAKSLKTGEARVGIQSLWPREKQFSTLFKPYLDLIHAINTDGVLRYYPGSPRFALQALRPLDRLYCCELHPEEFQQLKRLPHAGKRVFFSQSDGISALEAVLPPTEHRGLVFIDPTYEIKTEYKTIPRALEKAVARFSNGVYCLWYPLVTDYYRNQLIRGCEQIGAKNTLHIEVSFNLPKGAAGMSGCGLWMINPPHTLKTECSAILAELGLRAN
jgi:23S rRNA (adenine2030-N6)-methyltransferase